MIHHIIKLDCKIILHWKSNYSLPLSILPCLNLDSWHLQLSYMIFKTHSTLRIKVVFLHLWSLCISHCLNIFSIILHHLNHFICQLTEHRHLFLIRLYVIIKPFIWILLSTHTIYDCLSSHSIQFLTIYSLFISVLLELLFLKMLWALFLLWGSELMTREELVKLINLKLVSL